MFRPVGVILSIVIPFLLAAAPAGGEGRQVRVLERTASGYVPRPGEWRSAPPEAGKQRSFNFDMVTQKRPAARFSPDGRRLLGAKPVEGIRRVALIRVSFKRDRLGSCTTGDGKFNLTPNGTSPIDPTPHDKAYFEAHLQAMSAYYDFQSCGRLEITGDVLPSEDTLSYQLTDIADYGPGCSGYWTVEMLVHFVQAAMAAADQGLREAGYPVRFSDYDAYLIVHAGANLQSDVRANSSSDIPSFFVSLGDGDEIVVDGGATVITDLSVVPETAIQDGFYGGVAAVYAHEFGHALGLPDLYDIYNNMPIVGGWDNMDSGGQLGAYLYDPVSEKQYYSEGFIPGGLSAWSRYLLGWVEVDTVRTYEDLISLSAVEKCPARIVRIDIAQDEFYLVENRVSELDDLYTGLMFDSLTGVVLGTGNCLNCGGSEYPDEPLWEPTNGYDLFLPTESSVPAVDGGPGILVWHINEYFVARRWQANEVNSLWPFGVSLVEASGIVDLGNPYSRFHMGWYDDAFYEGNASLLCDSSMPASWSHWNVPTGVSIENVSARDTLMTFGGGVRDLRRSTPFPYHSPIAPRGLLPLEEDFQTLMIDVDGRGWVAGRENPVFTLGSAALTPAARAEDFDNALGGGAVIVGEKSGLIHALREGSYQECTGAWPVQLDSLCTHPVVLNTEAGPCVAAADIKGYLHLMGNDGIEKNGSPAPPDGASVIIGNLVVQSDTHRAASGLFVLRAPDDYIQGATLSRFNIVSAELVPDTWFNHHLDLTAAELQGALVLLGGDINPGRNGNEVYIVSLETGKIILCGLNGVLYQKNNRKPITGIPALQDINGDGWIDLIYTDGYSIQVISPSGANVTGWPRVLNEIYDLPVTVRVSVSLTTASQRSGSWVVAGTDIGIIYIFDHAGELVAGYPKRIAGAFDQPLDLMSPAGKPVFMYLDALYNRGENPFYDFRPAGGVIKWRAGPFGAGSLDRCWTSLYGDLARTAFAQPARGFTAAARNSWTDLERNLIIYPNPSAGDRIGFHFQAPDRGDARLQIMNLSGELILELSKALSGGDDEFTVSMAGKVSGIYICRLVITSRGSTVETSKKFAIVN
ncbi:MAG: T9SS type A sorting domain-containing protein [Candidatus Krumholzibacteriota bacterium]|nr:T9SS type A sorting domain-containing protein [Candidatus Krumholzibacteriota bacterium]